MGNRKLANTSLLNYIFIIYSILRLPIHMTMFSFDGKGRILLFLTIIIFIQNLNSKKFRNIAFSTPAIFWFGWIILSIVNLYFQGFKATDITFGYFAILRLFSPFVVLTVTAYEYTEDSDKLTKYLLYAFIVYSIIGFFFLDNFYVAKQEGREADATLGNLLALNTIFIAFFAGLRYSMGKFSLRTMYMLILFSIFIITISATRKAFGAVIIIYLMTAISKMKFNASNIIKLFFIVGVLYVGLEFVMENTFLGERMNEIEDETLNIDVGNNLFLKAMGGRAFYYLYGWNVFLDNPILGIGITNFRHYTGTEHMLHTEYMVQLTECGIIGSTLFVCFYLQLISKTIRVGRSIPNNKPRSIVILGAVFAILFVSLTAWTYDFAFYFAVLGTVLGFIHDRNKVVQPKE